MTAWVLNALSVFLVMVGAMLIFLYLWKAPRFADQWLSADAKGIYAKNRILLMVAMALFALWFLIQYVALLLV